MAESEYVSVLKEEFHAHSHDANAEAMKAYMKGKFEFIGLKSPLRKELQSPFLIKSALPPLSQLDAIIRELWLQPEREFQYFAQELLNKYAKLLTPEHLALVEYMIIEKSWWDTIDFIASNVVGSIFKNHPEAIKPYTNKWMQSENMWLQRTCLLFQLKYKDQCDTELLKGFISQLNTHPDFFIRKAIGWSLRQHSKLDPQWVRDVIHEISLSNLSVREASKYI